MSQTEVISQAQPEFRPSEMPPRFHSWATLNQAERLACVSPERFLPFEALQGWRYAWLPDGLLKHRWCCEFSASCKMVIDNPENRRRLSRGFWWWKSPNNLTLLHTRLLMLAHADTRTLAEPVIIFEHSDQHLLNAVLDLFGTQNYWHGLGFQFAARLRQIRLRMNSLEENPRFSPLRPRRTDSPKPDHLDQGYNLPPREDLAKDDTPRDELKAIEHLLQIGSAPMSVRDDQKGTNWHKEATVGGLLIIQDTLFALTVAHVFFGERTQFDMPNEQSPENQYPMTVSLQSTVDIEVIQATSTSQSLQIKAEFDSRSEDGRNTLCSIEHDWALIPLIQTGAAAVISGMKMPEIIIRRVYEEPDPPLVHVLICGGKSGPRTGWLLPTVSFLTLPWSQESTTVWTVAPDETKHTGASDGDSGSWVVNQDLETVYGLVIADAAESGETYVLPAHIIFADIQQNFGIQTNALSEMLPGTRIRSQSLSSAEQSGDYRPHQSLVDGQTPLLGQNQWNPREDPAWTVTLPSGLRQLVETVPNRDYASFARVIRRYRDLISEADERVLLTEAIAALCERQVEYAENCVEKFILIGECRKTPSAYFDRYLKRLEQRSNRLDSRFSRKMRTIMAQCKAKADEQLQSIGPGDVPARHRITQADTISEAAATAESMSLPRKISYNRFRGGQQGILTRHESVTSTATSGRPRREVRLAEEPATEQVRDSKVEFQDNQSSITGSSNFKTRTGTEARDFFCVGRVFTIFQRVQDTGGSVDNDDPTADRMSTYIESLDIYFVTHKSRFVVVREVPGACWAIPISTYGGRGMHKFSRRDEIRDHAIIYTSQSPETVTIEGVPEPKMAMEPIKVKSKDHTDPECRLDKASRVNFSKVTTIQHNVKAFDIGIVDERSMPFLTSYWKGEMGKKS